MDKSEIDFRNFDLVVVDTEFTGLELKHELVEIGFVKLKHGTLEVIAEKSIKIKPTHLENANAESLAISGYNEKGWADAVDLKTGIQDFLTYTDGCMLVGHNLGMDWAFIKKAIEDCGLTSNFYYKGLDTFSIAWAKLRDKKEFKRFSLTELAPYFGIDMGHHHRALDDARTTCEVFKKLAESA